MKHGARSTPENYLGFVSVPHGPDVSNNDVVKPARPRHARWEARACARLIALGCLNLFMLLRMQRWQNCVTDSASPAANGRSAKFSSS